MKVSHRLEEAIARRGRDHDAAPAARADDRAGFIPSIREYSRVWGLTLAKLAPVPARRADHAPGPGEPRRRALARGGRRPVLGDPRPGGQRRRGADGGALPAGRRARRGMSLLIRNGRVVDPANGTDAVPGRPDRGRPHPAGRPRAQGARGRPRPSTPPARSSARASSTSTCTCASPASSTRRRSRPARAPPPRAASPRWPAWPTPSRSTTTARSPTTSWPRAKVEGVVRVYPIGAVTRNLEGKAARRDGRAGRGRLRRLLRRRQVRDERRALPPGHGVRAALRHPDHQPRGGLPPRRTGRR